MHLVSLELNGFKSFAQKTKIEFMPGMTGIVGPNGSGKSNIIEAIRWVMGEQSAKDLRGDKMADVIFAGSATRKPLNRAEVSIVFDNSDHYLASEFNEIKITRRLFRNGDSQYLINNTECRLKDVVTLFMDSGLGRESFSIISQGRVEEIFNGKPQDRRAVIEEVAGVAKYKKNKDTAEKRLQDTNDNLHRINDIIHELEGQIAPLEQQSALAKDYLDQKKRFDLLDRTKTVYQIETNQQQQDAIVTRVQNAENLRAQYDDQSNTASTVLNELKQQQTKLSAQKDNFQQQRLNLTQEIANLQNTSNLNSERQKNQQANLEQLSAQKQKLQTQLDDARNQLAELKKIAKTQTDDIQNEQQQIHELESLSATQRQEKLQEHIEQLQNQQVDLMQELTTVHNQKTFLKRNFDQDSQRQSQLELQIASVKQETEDLQQIQNDLKNKVADQTQSVKTIETKFNQGQAHHESLQSQYDNARTTWYDGLAKLQSAQSKLDTYRSLDADYAGFYQGVRFVLQHKNQFNGLFGPVAELLKVPTKYTQAIETVLGAQLQNIVVSDQSVGKDIIKFLIDNRAGRVTILPINDLRIRSTDQQLISQLATMSGFEGQASQVVNGEKSVAPVINYLLGGTIIADTLDHATNIAKSARHRFRIVTLDGQLINASGAMTGGANKHQQQGLLSRQKDETSLADQVNILTTQNNKLEEQVSQFNQAIKANQTVQTKVGDQLANAKQGLQELLSKQSVNSEKLTLASRRLNAINYESTNQKDMEANYDQQVKDNETKAQQLTDQIAQLKQAILAAKHDSNELANDASVQEEQLQTHKRVLAVINEKAAHTTEQLNTVTETITNLEHDIAQLTGQASEQKMSKAQQEKTQKAAKDQLTRLTAQQAEAEKQLQQVSEELDAQADEIQIADQKLTRLQELQRAALDELNEVNTKQARIEAAIDNGLNRLAEQYKMSLTEAKQNLSDLETTEIDTQLKLLKKGLDEIGTVNLGAIDEFDRVSKRYDFLHEQQEDLLTSKEQLNDTMQEMDQEVITRFEAAYHEIATAFEKIFVQMFGGGQAKLVLTDPDDMLTTGIDIIAQPPGKKNQQLSLLSGGERALTAITLLFSILAVRPVPFAILDETEAALDEANVNRFARYLSTYGDDGPQFIVVTHRKGTMMNAKVLYGVTMQESGVSKMVSVSLEDVAKD